jgi:PHS family inorganic phosphate transporter-like MFS transporter
MRQVAEDGISPTTTRPDSYPASINSSQSSAAQVVTPPVDLPAFWTAFREFALKPRAFRLLFATCSCWFLLDIPFYGLGLLSPDIIRTIWSGSDTQDPPLYDSYFQNSYRSMVVVSSGAVIGNLLAIFTIDRLGRRKMQLNGFFWLFILNLLIGATFRPLARGHDSSALIVFYVLSQVFFNFGKSLVRLCVLIPRLDELTRVCRTEYNNLYSMIWLPTVPLTSSC